MPEKSSAKLGEVKGHRGGNDRRGSEVRCERGAPLAGAAWYAPTACAERRQYAGEPTWSDHGVRAAPEVAISREGEAALGD